MKKITKYILCLIMTLTALSGCDNGFEELNTNKIVPTSLDPAYMMNNAIVTSSYSSATLVFEIAVVQQIISPFGGALVGGNHNIDNRQRNADNWQGYYRNVIKHTTEVKRLTVNDPTKSNLYNMARIWNSMAFMLVTDTYGDVPYKEAGKGYTDAIVIPKYDSQESIYTDILKELDEASAALDPAKTVITSDVLYNGNIARWKKLGYSAMLRAAMRLSKVDPAKAEAYAKKAAAGGLMTSNDDDAIIRHSAQYLNSVGSFLNAAEANNYYLTENFVNYLKANNDPRLVSIAVRYIGATSGPAQTASRANREADKQVGMPVGNDVGTIPGVATGAGLASFYDYSQLDRTRMGNTTTPMFILTHAQTQLLLAEAVTRGWVTGAGTAALLYANGIRAHMQSMAKYNTGSAITEANIVTYLGTHPLTPGQELQLINTQYWVVSFLNGPEAFANFRRSGYPALTPNPYKGDIPPGSFIRRLTYTDPERAVNAANIQEANTRQGADKMDTRVWWDK